MYRGKKILLIAPAYDEEKKIGPVVENTPRDVVDTVLVVDDGSSDSTARVAREAGARVISLGRVLGVGAAIRAGYDLAVKEGFDVAVTIAGNGKDDPGQIPRLLDPVVDSGADFVMGSRYLDPSAMGPMPAYRKLATRMHPLLVSLLTRKRVTESTNGFRAVTRRALTDPRINLNQAWLDHYELEVYLLIRVLQLGLPRAEVPVTKIYPPKALGQTKMRPVLDWYKMLSPVFLVGLGLKK